MLLSPFGFSPTGEAFNLTMEDVATSTAIALRADKLLFLTEVLGIHEEPGDPTSPIDTELALVDARRLLSGLPNPTLPTDTGFYLQHCVRACEGGVERSHILPFAADGALLLEVFTHDGIGTMVVDEKLESLREATANDVGGILQLIEPFERDGTLVRRERTEIERDIANYSVIEHDGIIFGCAALYPYPEARTGEMAALTVSPQVQSQGDGERILKRIEQRAKSMGLESIFVLTTRTMHWFIKRGFVQVDPDHGCPKRARRNTTGTGARRCWSRSSADPALQNLEQEMNMARMVQCVYLKKEAPGLDFSPYPGELGKRIYDNVSKEAFEAWKKHQTMLVNENRLNLADARARQYLARQMEQFFFGEGAEQPAGYVPPTA